MLEGLDDIDWGPLDHAYGEGPELPELIRGLISADRIVRESSFGNLAERVLHQGTRYPATAPVMRFIVELVHSPECPDRLHLVRLLTWAADTEATYGWECQDYLKHRATAPPWWNHEELPNHLLDTFEAVRAGVSGYLSLLDSPDRSMRLAAAELVHAVATASPELAAQLFTRLQAERGPLIRAVLVWALRDAGDSSLLPYLVDELFLDHEAPLGLRWAAATVVAHWAGEKCHPDVIQLLSNALLNGEVRSSLAEAYCELEDFGNPTNAEWNLVIPVTCRALEHVPKAASLPIYLAAMHGIPPNASQFLVRSLARCFFGTNPIVRPPTGWDEHQKTVLRALADTHPLWEWYRFPYDLRECGLPSASAGLLGALD
jgi:hypothetical protein